MRRALAIFAAILWLLGVLMFLAQVLRLLRRAGLTFSGGWRREAEAGDRAEEAAARGRAGTVPSSRFGIAADQEGRRSLARRRGPNCRSR